MEELVSKRTSKREGAQARNQGRKVSGRAVRLEKERIERSRCTLHRLVRHIAKKGFKKGKIRRLTSIPGGGEGGGGKRFPIKPKRNPKPRRCATKGLSVDWGGRSSQKRKERIGDIPGE